MMENTKVSDIQILKVDVLLVTVTSIEARSVLEGFKEELGHTSVQRFINGRVYFDLGHIGGAHVVMVPSESGTIGPGGALLEIDESIRVLSPSAVIITGIAFGVSPKKQQIGDILVSQQLFGYELQRITTNAIGEVKIISRGDRPHASLRLLDGLRSGLLDWQGPNVEFGLILSGDKLVDSRQFREQLIELAPEAIGGEMEGAGLYSVAHRRKVDWIIVKGISDWADGNKFQDRGSHQRVAAENAVRFIIHMLKQGGLTSSPSSKLPNTENTSLRPERGTIFYRYDAHSSWVLTVAWEPGGTHIASAGADGTVRVWEAKTGEALATYHGHTRLLNKANIPTTIYTLAWSPEGLRIASGGSGTKVYIWNAATGQTLTLYEGHSGLLPYVWAIAWSPDGKRIASACSITGRDKTIHIWNPDTGQTLTRYDAYSGWILNFAVFSLAWSPDGTYLAAACADKILRVWNTETGQLVSTYSFRSEWSSHLAWSPDSRYLAFVASNHKIQIRDMLTKANIVTYNGHTDGVRYIVWSPDGTSIATASNDRTVHIWEALTGNSIYIYRGHSDWVTSVAWSPDGTRIASASNDRTVHIWQAV